MSLKTKIIGIMLAAIVLYGIANLSILRLTLYPRFIQYERQDALKDADRVKMALQREIHHLDSLCHDWAAWDDTYDFVQTGSPQYIHVNLPQSTFKINHLNLIYILNGRREVVWGSIFDHNSEDRIALTRFPKDVFPSNHLLLNFDPVAEDPSKRSVAGLFNTESGPMLVASRPVLTSDDSGPVRGAVMMGRFLTDDLIDTLRAQTGVDFSVGDLSNPDTLRAYPAVAVERTGLADPIVDAGRRDVLRVHTTISGLGKSPGILIRFQKPRTIADEGVSTLRFAALSIFAAGAVLLGLIGWLIQRTVTGPIGQVTRHMLDVGKTGDLSTRLELKRNDELGVMGKEYDTMLALLAKKSQELSDDIEKRRRAEEALLNQQEAFRAITETARDAIVMIDDQGRISFWSRAGENLLGFSESEAMGRELHTLMAPHRFLAPYLRGFDGFLKTGTGPMLGRTVELMARHRDGHEVPVELSLAAAQQDGRWHAVGILRDITERKSTENALCESEERYRRVMEAAPNAINITTEKEGIFQEVNEFFTILTGYSRDEALGRTSLDLNLFVDPGDRGRFLAVLDRTGEVNSLEIQVRKRDGTIIDTVFAVRRLRYDDKDSIVSVISDISDRKRAEKALAESEKRYRTLFERAGDAIFIMEAEGPSAGRIVNANQAAATMHGYRREEILGMDIRRLDTPEAAGKTAARIKRMVRGEWIQDEVTHIRSDGTVFPVEISAGLIEMEGRKYILAFDRDISDRKKAEEERLLLATTIEQSPDLVYITDTEGRIEYVNPSFVAATGFSREEVIGKPVSVFKNRLHGRMSNRSIWEHLLQGRPWKGRMHNRRRDGAIFDVQVAASPVTNAAGVIIKFVSVERDITDDLQRERQLRQAQKLEAIGTLAGGVAHDFNNILSGIIGFTEIALLDIDKGSPVRANLQKVLSASERAGDLVRQILAFSRKGEQEHKPIPVRMVVSEALKLCRASLPAFIEIREHLQSDPAVMGDSSQIHQVVINLCTNAGHAMEESGGVLTLRLEIVVLEAAFTDQYPPVGPGAFVKLSVEDTGCGIAPEIMDRLFDPFFTTKKKGKGTGLGLSVVHGIVEGHGGILTVASRPGKGSAFTVYLPAVEMTTGNETAVDLPLPGGTERILFVDDEPLQVDLGMQALGRLGYRVVTETDSRRALELFSAAPDAFDLVMTDMTMPLITGDELGRAVLKIRPDIPVILCTGYSERITEGRAEAMGFRGFAMKPMVVSQIAKLVRSVLDGAGRSEP